MVSSGAAEHLLYQVVEPGDLDSQEWRVIQSLHREALSASLITRSQQEIDHLLHWGHPDAYIASRLDPNVAVEAGEFRAGQLFAKPLVGLAYDGGNPVGYVYSANNTSGVSRRERERKMVGTARRYGWFREAAVLPDRWSQGIARRLGELSLEHEERSAEQPLTAYTWRELPRTMDLLRKLGFIILDEPQDIDVFGYDNPPAVQFRFVAEYAGDVLKRLQQSLD